MRKTCIAENCINPVFSHMYCQRHQYLRTDKKRKEKALKIKVTTVKDIACDFGYENQISMFHALWDGAKNERGQVLCPYTGEKLNKFYSTEMWFSCFAHILNKKNYTYFKLNPANVSIVHPDFHKIIDAGTLKDRELHPKWKWDLWDARVIAMKEEYQKFKTKHLLR